MPRVYPQRAQVQHASQDLEPPVPDADPSRPDRLDLGSAQTEHRGFLAGILGLFALVWTVMPLGLLLACLGVIPSGRHPVPWGAALVAGLFLLGVAIHLGLRRSILDVLGPAFLLTERSPVRTRQVELPADQVRSVNAADSSMEVNGRPLPELRIERAAGPALHLLIGRDRAELEWIAHELRQALAPAPAPHVPGA